MQATEPLFVAAMLLVPAAGSVGTFLVGWELMALTSLLLVLAEHAGVEVSQAQFELEDARSSLIRARATTHAANVDSVEAQVEAGLAGSSPAWSRGRQAFSELRYRRLGLAVSSAIIIVLVVGLVIRIRETEEKRQGKRSQTGGRE